MGLITSRNITVEILLIPLLVESRDFDKCNRASRWIPWPLLVSADMGTKAVADDHYLQ
jgi:hypothetical protein